LRIRIALRLGHKFLLTFQAAKVVGPPGIALLELAGWSDRHAADRIAQGSIRSRHGVAMMMTGWIRHSASSYLVLSSADALGAAVDAIASIRTSS
jgi:hypothetical protein